MARDEEQKITVRPHGPYLVRGNIPLVRKSQVMSEYGEPLDWKMEGTLDKPEPYLFCRCGQSKTKPFCDGTHTPVAFAAMAYHLDWIRASLFLTLPGNDEDAPHPNTETVATGNQEDVDLLIAFEEGDINHLLLIEAKSTTGWTNKQTLSKAQRLERIFGTDDAKYSQVKPHFGPMSPRAPNDLKPHLWPVWMTRDGKEIWLELKMPPG